MTTKCRLNNEGSEEAGGATMVIEPMIIDTSVSNISIGNSRIYFNFI